MQTASFAPDEISNFYRREQRDIKVLNMGSEQSVRKLTIDNEEIGVIGISESVVKRLAQHAKETRNTAGEVRSSSFAELPSKRPVTPPHAPSSDTLAAPPYPGQYLQLTLTALKMQQEKEHELRVQDNYWQKRVQSLEERHSKINDIIDKEYKKAEEQLYASGKKDVNIQNAIQPCKGSSEKVLQCYQAHPKESLKCSNLVEEFSTCVDQRRARVIAARC